MNFICSFCTGTERVEIDIGDRGFNATYEYRCSEEQVEFVVDSITAAYKITNSGPYSNWRGVNCTLVVLNMILQKRAVCIKQRVERY